MQDSNYPMAPPPPPPPPPPAYGSPLMNPYAAQNPYAAPAAGYAVPGSPLDAERIRRELVNHESGIKAIGFLYLLGAVGIGIAGLGLLVGLAVGVSRDGDAESIGVAAGMMLFALLVAGLYLWIGAGLRRLDRKVRTFAIVLAVVGLLGFPLGTLLNAYFLSLLAGEKGSRVLSPEYQQVVAATPHIRPPFHWVLAMGLGLLLLALIVLVFVALAG